MKGMLHQYRIKWTRVPFPSNSYRCRRRLDILMIVRSRFTSSYTTLRHLLPREIRHSSWNWKMHGKAQHVARPA